VVAGLARAGRVVAAVCHGPMGLVNVKDAEGESILKGREVGWPLGLRSWGGCRVGMAELCCGLSYAASSMQPTPNA